MKVLVLTPFIAGTAPGQRFRIEQWAPYLRQRGLELTFLPFEDESLHDVLYERGRYRSKAWQMLRGLSRRRDIPAIAAGHDVVFLYREACLIGPAWAERAIASRGVPIVYDFDDPIWLSYRSPTNAGFSFLKWQRKTAAICRLAHTVIVGNRLLAAWAERHARRVEIVPATIDLNEYQPRAMSKCSEVVTLGWTGSHSTLPFLDMIRGALERLARRRKFRFMVISHTDQFHMPGLEAEVVAKRWNAATEAGDLSEIDVGLGPFPNVGWTPWRCHGKVLQYMAAGLPTVASRIGIMPDYIQHGVHGFLADTEDDWVDMLERLIDDGELRRTMGKQARAKIEQEYAAERWAERVADILRTAAGSRLGPNRMNGMNGTYHAPMNGAILTPAVRQ